MIFMVAAYLKPDVERQLLEEVGNGRAIYAANLQMYAEAGRSPVPATAGRNLSLSGSHPWYSYAYVA